MDLFVLMFTIFGHCAVLVGMGALTAFMIFDKTKTYMGADYSTEVPIDKAWRLLLFGVLMGSIDYVAGWAVTVSKTTLLEMIGFTSHAKKPKTITNTQETTAQFGTVTTNISALTEGERKKPFWAIIEI